MFEADLAKLMSIPHAPFCTPRSRCCSPGHIFLLLAYWLKSSPALAALLVFQSQRLSSSLGWPSWHCCFFLTVLGKLCSSSSVATLKGRSMISVKSGRDSLEVSRLLWMKLRSERSPRG